MLNIDTVEMQLKQRISKKSIAKAMIDLNNLEKTIDRQVDLFYSELNSGGLDPAKIAQLATDYLKPFNDALDRHNSASFVCKVSDLSNFISKKMYLKRYETKYHLLKGIYDKLGDIVNHALSKSGIISCELIQRF